MRILDSAGVTPKWDDEQKAWYAMWESRGVFRHAWIEDARAFMDNLEPVRSHGLRGYSVWLLGMEDPRVWNALRAASGRD